MILIVIGIITLLAPTRNADTAMGTIGAMLLICAALYTLVGLRRANASGQRRAWLGSSLTLLMGLLLLNAPTLAGTALILGLTLWYFIDGLSQAATLFTNNPQHDLDRRWIAAAAVGNLGVAAVLLVFATYSPVCIAAIAGALCIFGTAWDILITPVHERNEAADTIAADLNLDGEAGKHAVEDAKRISQIIDGTDGAGLLAFTCILFAIHLSRMGFDRTWPGVMSPTVAAIGDLLFALVIAYFIIIPLRIAWMKLTTGWEGSRVDCLWQRNRNVRLPAEVLPWLAHADACASAGVPLCCQLQTWPQDRIALRHDHSRHHPHGRYELVFSY